MSVISFNFGANKKEKEELRAERERLEKFRHELEDQRALIAVERVKTDSERQLMKAGQVLWTVLSDDLLLSPWLYPNEHTAWERWSSLMSAVELIDQHECLDALKKHLINKRVY